MGRNKKHRLIQRSPNFSGFRPFGTQQHVGKEIVLHFEEYEALKLCDYDILTHEEAAQIMNVSRPTFTRVYASARRKIATAFAETAVISIQGGNTVVNNQWYTCKACIISFSLSSQKNKQCPLCHSKKITENA